MVSRQRLWQIAQRRKGNCTCCGQTADGKELCPPCQEAKRRWLKALCDRRRVQGLCVRCGQPEYKGGRCRKHYEYNLAKGRAYQAKLRREAIKKSVEKAKGKS